MNIFATCCNLDEPIGDKEISIEEALLKSDIVFRGVQRPFHDFESKEHISYFDVITVYKGETYLKEWRKLNNYFR